MLERALAAAQQGNCGAALPDLRSIAEHDNRIVPALNALAGCETQMGHPELATPQFERVAHLEPGAWQAWNNLGANYLQLNEPQKAAEALHNAVRLSPHSANPWFQLGSALLKLGQLEDAFDALDHAQRLAPADTQIGELWLNAAGRIATDAADCIETGQYEKATGLLERVHRPLQKSPSWNNLLGYAQFKLDKPRPALQHLQQALALEPDNEDYLLDLGEFLSHNYAYNNAVELFQVARTRMPRSKRVQFGLAVSYILINRRDEATRLLESLIAADSHFEAAYRALGECYEDAGNWAGMVQLGEKLQALYLSSALGWYLQGAGRLKLSSQSQISLADSISALKRAEALDPASSRIHFTLAKAYEQNHENELAVQQLKETLRLEPQHERAHYVLGRLYQQMGETELAKRELQIHSRIKAQDRNTQYRALLIASHHP